MLALCLWVYGVSTTSESVLVFGLSFVIDAVIIVLIVFGTRKRRMRVLQQCVPIDADNPLEARTANSAQKMGVLDWKIYLARSVRFKKAFGGQMGIRKPLIVISEALLRELSLEEQDAIVAHELAHFRMGHLWKQNIISMLFFLTGLDIAGDSGPPPLPETWVTVMFLTGLALLFGGFLFLSPLLSRRSEIEADQLVVETLGGGEVLSSALTKLDALYPEPRTWKIWRRTHPPTSKRLRMIEKRSNQITQSRSR